MSAEETAQLMHTYRVIEGDRFRIAVQDAVAYIKTNEHRDSNVLYTLWRQLQENHGQLQVMTIVNDALGQIGTYFL